MFTKIMAVAIPNIVVSEGGLNVMTSWLFKLNQDEAVPLSDASSSLEPQKSAESVVRVRVYDSESLKVYFNRLVML